MLHLETVSQNTLALIKKLCADEHLKDFVLVGGTALALQIGHRISIDIDLFTQNSFNSDNLSNYLKEVYQAEITNQSKGGINCYIDDVKVDLVIHQYSQLKETISIDNIRMASLNDIAAMKINAIVGNGTRLKDFVDIYKLLEYSPLKDMINGYLLKYPKTDYQMAKSSLIYFKDITTKIDRINFIDKGPTMEQVQKRIIDATTDETKIFQHISQEQKLENNISKQTQNEELKRQQKQQRRPKLR